MAGERISHAFEIYDDQLEWIKEMSNKFNIPDDSKTLRVLIEYAISDGDHDAIFADIRCNRC